MDPRASSEERIVRGAVGLFISAEERCKGVQRLPAGRFDPHHLSQMLASCTAERDEVQALISGAGLTFGYSRNGRTRARLELVSAQVSVPLKINVSERWPICCRTRRAGTTSAQASLTACTGACGTSTAPVRVTRWP